MKIYQFFTGDYTLCFQEICKDEEELIGIANGEYNIDLSNDDYWFEELKIDGYKIIIKED